MIVTASEQACSSEFRFCAYRQRFFALFSSILLLFQVSWHDHHDAWSMIIEDQASIFQNVDWWRLRVTLIPADIFLSCCSLAVIISIDQLVYFPPRGPISAEAGCDQRWFSTEPTSPQLAPPCPHSLITSCPSHLPCSTYPPLVQTLPSLFKLSPSLFNLPYSLFNLHPFLIQTSSFLVQATALSSCLYSYSGLPLFSPFVPFDDRLSRLWKFRVWTFRLEVAICVVALQKCFNCPPPFFLNWCDHRTRKFCMQPT